MSTSVIDTRALRRELRRAGWDADVDAFLDILGRSARTTAAVPADARALMTRAGVDTGLLEPRGIAEARPRVIAAAAGSRQAAVESTISTKQAAALLGTADSNIRRSIAAGRIYSIGRHADGHRLPAWQFVGQRALPHLSDVLDALPEDLHPLEVQSFFTTPQESLNGMAPAQWLASGGPAAPVEELAEDESRR